MTQPEITALIDFAKEFDRKAASLRLGPTEISRRTETDELKAISAGYISDILRVGRGDSDKRFRIQRDKVVRLSRAVEWDEREALALAGFKGSDADTGAVEPEDTRAADAAFLSEAVGNLAMIPPDLRAQALAFLKIMSAEHPEALQILGSNFEVIDSDKIDQDEEHIKIDKK